eukprot:15436116-Alexandrium_andersonii.AAC.1
MEGPALSGAPWEGATPRACCLRGLRSRWRSPPSAARGSAPGEGPVCPVAPARSAAEGRLPGVSMASTGRAVASGSREAQRPARAPRVLRHRERAA